MTNVGYGAKMGIAGYIAGSTINRIFLESPMKSTRDLIELLGKDGWEDCALVFRRAFRKAIENEAKQAIRRMRTERDYADHVSAHPECIAYAIQNNMLSWREKRKIRKHLDHEDSLEEFCKEYGRSIEDLPEQYMRKFFGIPEKPKINSVAMPEPYFEAGRRLMEGQNVEDIIDTPFDGDDC